MPRSEIFEVNGWVDEPYVNSLVSAPFLRHTKALWLGFKGGFIWNTYLLYPLPSIQMDDPVYH